MTVAAFSKNDLALLGRLLIKKQPQVASALMDDFRNVNMPPAETDLSLLPTFFSSFCSLYGMQTSNLVAAKYNRALLAHKRVFIGAILSLYSPGVIQEPELLQQNKRGIIYKIAEVFDIDHSNTSKMVREVILSMKVYDSFRQEVVNVTEKLSSHGKSSEQKNN